MVDLTSCLCFRFIKLVMNLTLVLAINRVISTKRGYYQFCWIVIVIGGNKPLKEVLDCQNRLPSNFFLLDSFSMRPNNKVVIITLLITFWHKSHYFKGHQSLTPYYCQLQTRNLAIYYLFATFIRNFVITIYEKDCKFSNF